MRAYIEIRDQFGVRVNYIDGTAIDGPALGVRNLTYTPRGGVLDKIGELRFDLPMHIRRNIALRGGLQVLVYEIGISGPVGQFIVTEKSESVSRSGHFATFTCPEVTEELRWATVTTGFATAPGETLYQTVARLCGRQQETPWTAAAHDLGAVYDGLPYSAYGLNVAGALGKLGNERLAHWKRGDGRVIVFGRFGQDSGLRIIGPTHAPGRAAQNPYIRQIVGDPGIEEDSGNIVNDLVPLGTGNNSTQLRLAVLYNLGGAFVGYNPLYPIRVRLRQDAPPSTLPLPRGGAVTDDPYYEYYIQHDASIAKYRRRSDTYVRDDIAPVGTTTTDEINAAAAVYMAAVTHLERNAYPTLTLKVVTEGRGDVRDIAGKTVPVFFRKVNSDGLVTTDINNVPFVVMSVQRAVDTAQDTWELSSSGRYAEDGMSQIVGALDQQAQERLTPTIYPVRFPVFHEKDLNDTHPIKITVPGDKSILKVVAARITVIPMPVQSTASTITGGEHTHDVTIPPLTVNDLVVPDHKHTFNKGVHSHKINKVSVFIENPPLTKDRRQFNTPDAGAVFGLTDVQTTSFTSGEHTHGMEASAVWDTDPTIADGGGFTKGTTTKENATTAPGGSHNHGIAYDIFEGPQPNFLSIWVNGVQVSGWFSAQFSMDIAQWLNPQADNLVEVHALSLGRAQIIMLVRQQETTLYVAA